MLATYVKYYWYNEWLKARGQLSEFDSLRSTGQWKTLIIEYLLILMGPFPHMQDLKTYEYIDAYKITIQYRVNDILLCLTFVRFYLFLRMTLVMSQYMNPRSKRVCSLNGCEANLSFAVKAYMK
jgi:hypothetical protein